MHIFDIITWFRLGTPPGGEIRVSAKNTYPYEEGIEVPDRLTKAFGDPTRLTVIDLGAGPGESDIATQILTLPCKRLVSAEAFIPYVTRLRRRESSAERHDIYTGRIEHVFDEFKPRQIDVALLIDVLEHFSRREALSLLCRLERFVRVGVAIFAPIGDVAQEPYDENELQRHRSFWETKDLARLGYDVDLYKGLHGHLDPPADAAWAIKRWGPLD